MGGHMPPVVLSRRLQQQLLLQQNVERSTIRRCEGRACLLRARHVLARHRCVDGIAVLGIDESKAAIDKGGVQIHLVARDFEGWHGGLLQIHAVPVLQYLCELGTILECDVVEGYSIFDSGTRDGGGWVAVGSSDCRDAACHEQRRRDRYGSSHGCGVVGRVVCHILWWKMSPRRCIVSNCLGCVVLCCVLRFVVVQVQIETGLDS
mmetsp:Transcript_21568/g.60034  ORF Transcript_21568/g.60034 Transcript_21568/m.60034 type:complete len:206 (+) Transcript_21568:1551-2168(+)